MKFRFLLLAIMGIQTLLCAQKNNETAGSDYKPHCRVMFEKILLEGNRESDVKQFLNNILSPQWSPGTGLQLAYVTESPLGYHYAFTQTYNGVAVYQSEVKVNIGRNNVVFSIFDNSYTTAGWPLQLVGAAIDESAAIKAYQNALYPKAGIKEQGAAIIYSEAEQLPAYAQRVVFTDPQAQKTMEVIFSAGQVVYQRDLNCYFAPPDSTVTGKIFNPDPLTTAQHVYGDAGIYVDNDDANALWLTNQQQVVSFKADYSNSLFKLRNNYIELIDIDTPYYAPVTSSTGQFYYDRSQSGFEDVNAFYHLNNYRQHAHALGFNLADALLQVDVHGRPDDQSVFSYSFSPPRINYGTGGVDDAEDADVILHEYGHFLSYNASPGSNTGSQRNSLDEAFGDYIAASYSKAINPYHSDSIFNWDGHNQYWSGRIVTSAKVYPTDLVSSVYKNSEIWSAALMEIYDEIGKDATDSLIYQAHYFYSGNMNMADAGQVLLDVDSAFGGAYHCPVYRHLYAHGLVGFVPNTCGVIGITETLPLAVGFMQNAQAFTLVNNTGGALAVQITAINGQTAAAAMYITENIFTYNNSSMPAGIYLVTVKAGNSQKTFKWCKLN